jgi:uncharacterized membrane protein YfcA
LEIIDPAMSIFQVLFLLAAGLFGGIAGTVASVASLVSYPVLLALGLPPLTANVTNTMSLVFTTPGAVLGSRAELAGQRPRVLRFSLVTAVGGALGAAVLLVAPPGAFALAVPAAICAASVLVLLQPRLRALSPAPGATVQVAARGDVRRVGLPRVLRRGRRSDAARPARGDAE